MLRLTSSYEKDTGRFVHIFFTQFKLLAYKKFYYKVHLQRYFSEALAQENTQPNLVNYTLVDKLIHPLLFNNCNSANPSKTPTRLPEFSQKNISLN